MRRSRRRSRAGFVYILHKRIPRGFDHYKIGKTRRDIKGRLSEARTGSSHPVELYAQYKVRDRHGAERRLHRLFEQKRIQAGSQNEWFRLNILDLRMINLYMERA